MHDNNKRKRVPDIPQDKLLLAPRTAADPSLESGTPCCEAIEVHQHRREITAFEFNFQIYSTNKTTTSFSHSLSVFFNPKHLLPQYIPDRNQKHHKQPKTAPIQHLVPKAWDLPHLPYELMKKHLLPVLPCQAVESLACCHNFHNGTRFGEDGEGVQLAANETSSTLGNRKVCECMVCLPCRAWFACLVGTRGWRSEFSA